MNHPGALRAAFRSVTLMVALIVPHAAVAATLGPSLASKLDGLPGGSPVGVVIVSFNSSSGLAPLHLTTLALAGVGGGSLMPHLGMVAAPMTARQVRSLAASPAVRSLWLNDRLRYLNDQTRVLTGADRTRDDPGFAALHGGLPVTGQGIGILINDSGIDATHPDLPFGSRVVQNVLSIAEITTVAGFTLLPALEGLPTTDSHSGHGTHCAGIAAGTGAASGGRYAGVAPGAHLVGYGSGAALFMLNALGGFEYALANQERYNIRVISNSWGSAGPYEPDDPVALASQAAYHRGIVVIFAAGNAGPGDDTLHAEAKSPWVISVAAGTKEGGLATFSSRGVPKALRAPGDFNAPTITAPGTGRTFASSSGRLSLDVVSTRARTNLLSNGLLSQGDFEIAPADLLHYTAISGTSMAAPFVAGTVALMLSADPALTPAQVRSILRETATSMPGHAEHEVGAGYINVHAAVDKVFHRGKGYGRFGGPLDLQTFHLQTSVSTVDQRPFHLDYDPLSPPGAASTNALSFEVASGVSEIDVVATADSVVLTGDGNTVGLLLTDPAGRTWSSGLALPVLDLPRRQVVVAEPMPGTWRLEIRGLRSLEGLPGIALPISGAALPGPVHGTITQRVIQLPEIADLPADASRNAIESALRYRMLDVLPDGLFYPEAAVTRESFAHVLALNTPLRQSLADDPPFGDVAGTVAALAEAVTAPGSTLRDHGFQEPGLMSAKPPFFDPQGKVTRLDTAVALVRALGLDAAARSHGAAPVTALCGGQTVAVSDIAGIPEALRGFLQIALERGILQARCESAPPAALAEPQAPLTRASLAAAIVHFRQAFAAGS